MATFTAKSWEDGPGGSTPLSAAALIDMEQRIALYEDRLAGRPLRWAPPSLVNPIIHELDGTVHNFNLTAGRDHIMVMPSTPLDGFTTAGALKITGGRNVVIIGGEIDVATLGAGYSDTRAISLNAITGVCHIEGLWIHGDYLSEGIQIYCPQAIVQIQNTRIDDVHAQDEVDFTDNHPDLIQIAGGCRELRVDLFTGSTDYQGFFLAHEATAGKQCGPVYISRTNLKGNPQNRTLIWHTNPNVPVHLDDIYGEPTAGKDLDESVWPRGDYTSSDNASDGSSRDETYAAITNDDGSVAWPVKNNVRGRIQLGPPSGGDFVVTGSSGAGLDYVSPGYASAPLAAPAITSQQSIIPADHSLRSWNYLPEAATAAQQMVAGTVYFIRIPLTDNAVLANVFCLVSTQGSGFTSSQSYAGIYSADGIQVAKSADLATILNSVGGRTIPVTYSANLFAWERSYLFVALLANASVMPILRTGGSSASSVNINLGAAGGYRYSTFASTGQTDLPASIDPSTDMVSSGFSAWAGVN